jgi:hypothetical protein
MIKVRSELEVWFDTAEVVEDIEEATFPYIDAALKVVEERGEVLEADVMKDETSIVFVMVESLAELTEDCIAFGVDFEEIEEVEEAIVGVTVVVNGVFGGAIPFMPPGPSAFGAASPASAPAGPAATRMGIPSILASTVEKKEAFISNV